MISNCSWKSTEKTQNAEVIYPTLRLFSDTKSTIINCCSAFSHTTAELYLSFNPSMGVKANQQRLSEVHLLTHGPWFLEADWRLRTFVVIEASAHTACWTHEWLATSKYCWLHCQWEITKVKLTAVTGSMPAGLPRLSCSIEGNGNGQETCYSASYKSQTVSFLSIFSSCFTFIG